MKLIDDDHIPLREHKIYQLTARLRADSCNCNSANTLIRLALHVFVLQFWDPR